MGAAPVWSQWLKASTNPKYSIAQINAIPSATNGVQVITTLIYAWSSDGFLNGNRLPPIIFGGVRDRRSNNASFKLMTARS